jgi:DNA-binding MarR family transcriptional regulator
MRSHVDTRTGGRADAADASAAEQPAKAGRATGDTATDRRRAPADLGPLGDTVGYVLRRAQLAVFDEAIRGFARLDLRPGQYSVLVLLAYRPGMKQSEVAAALGIQRANFVSLLDRLERRGLARRSAAPNDRRSYVLHLTQDGERLLRRASAVVATLEARLDAKLGPGGRAQLLDLLARLIAV